MSSLDLEILYEDNDLLAVNKPYGVVVNRASSYDGETIQDWMQDRYAIGREEFENTEWGQLVPENFDSQYGTPEETFLKRVGMVHRLDKDTSGVLLLAKNPGSLVNLLGQFKDRTVQKTYLCLTHGKFVHDKGLVNMPIGRRRDNRQLFGIDPNGRPAETEFMVEQYFPKFYEEKLAKDVRKGKRFSLYQGFSLVECYPKTGRTHQIRVHMKHQRHPIVGDSAYVGKKRAKLDELWCPRQFLHARRISLKHPRTNEDLTISAELLPDLKQVLQFVGA